MAAKIQNCHFNHFQSSQISTLSKFSLNYLSHGYLKKIQDGHQNSRWRRKLTAEPVLPILDYMLCQFPSGLLVTVMNTRMEPFQHNPET